MSGNEEADDNDDDDDDKEEERLGLAGKAGFAIPYNDGCDGVGLASSVGLGGAVSVRVFCSGLVGDVEFDLLSAEDAAGGGGGGSGGGGPVTGAGGSLLDLDVLFDSVSLA